MFLNDRQFMTRALELAIKGEGSVNPNPLVGAVVVVDSKIAGEGWHQQFGGPHAEVIALDQAGGAANGSTLYVTLEPCCHHGETPPCTQRIIQSGVSRVVVATRDPNPVNNGKGLTELRDAGIEVVENVMEQEANQQNEIFRTFMIRHRPFAHLKLAISLDGRIATKTRDAKWISSEASRVRAHEMRRKCAAILVGVGTVLSDNPMLDVRHVEGADPRPIVLDPSGRIPNTSRLLQADRAPIIATHAMPQETEIILREQGAKIWRLPATNGSLDLQQLMTQLAEERVDSILIEGGGETAASFLNAGLVDKVSLFIAPLIIGGRQAIPSVGGEGIEVMADALHLHRVTTEWCGPDLLYEGYLNE